MPLRLGWRLSVRKYGFCAMTCKICPWIEQTCDIAYLEESWVIVWVSGVIFNNTLFHSSKCPGFNDELYVLPTYMASLVAQSKESSCNAGDQGLIPGSGRSPGEGNCLCTGKGWTSFMGYQPPPYVENKNYLKRTESKMKLQGKEWLLQDHFSFSEMRAIRPQKRPPQTPAFMHTWALFRQYFFSSFSSFIWHIGAAIQGTRTWLWTVCFTKQRDNDEHNSETHRTVRPTEQWAQQGDPQGRAGSGPEEGPWKI